jgi:hypothetical protein
MPNNSWGGERPGAGRPAGPKKVPLKICVLPATKIAIEKLAFSKGRTLGEIIDGKFGSRKEKQQTEKKQ